MCTKLPVKVYGSTQLDISIQEWHAKLPAQALRPWLDGLKLGLQSFFAGETSISTGSACSGSDLVSHCLRAWTHFCRSYFDLDLPDFAPTLAVELHDAKRAFLLAQHPDLTFVMSDVAQLHETKAVNCKTRQYEFIPYPSVMTAGFSCTARSRLNPKAKDNKHCVQLGTCSTGSTFSSIAQFIIRVKPKLSILENVIDLQEKDCPNDTSDEEYIVEYFDAEQMACHSFRLNSIDYGSCSARLRLYFVIFDQVPSGVTSSRFAMIAKLLEAMRVGPASFDRFVLMPEELVEWADVGSQPPKAKKLRESEKEEGRFVDDSCSPGFGGPSPTPIPALQWFASRTITHPAKLGKSLCLPNSEQVWFRGAFGRLRGRVLILNIINISETFL